MRILNPQNAKGQPLFVGKLITQLPEVTQENNGEIYIYVGNAEIVDVFYGDIFLVDQGKLVIIGRNSLIDTSQCGSLSVSLV